MKYAKVPFMHGYDASAPGEGFLSGSTKPAKPTKVILRASKTMAPGWPGFFAWLAQNYPTLYNQLRVQFSNLALFNQYSHSGAMVPGLSGDSLTPIDVTATTLPMPDSSGASSPSWSDQLVSAISSLAPTVIATVDQQKIFNTQLSRAQNGLPPLNTTSYGLPSMQGAVNTLMLPVIVLGGGVLLIATMRKRR
jgi:hypothetical protein